MLDFFQAANFAAILCGVCHTLLKPFSKSGKKSKKRREISEITVRKNLAYLGNRKLLKGALQQQQSVPPWPRKWKL